MAENTSSEPLPEKKKGGNQPKHHAPKSRSASLLRKKKLVKAVLKGHNLTQAGIDSGLSPKTADSQVHQILAQPQTQSILLRALEAAGLTESEMARQHLLLLNGVKHLPRRGRIVDIPDLPAGQAPDPAAVEGYIAVPDLQAKAKALEMAHKLTGSYTDKHEIDIKRPVNIVIRKFCEESAE